MTEGLLFSQAYVSFIFKNLTYAPRKIVFDNFLKILDRRYDIEFSMLLYGPIITV